MSEATGILLSSPREGRGMPGYSHDGFFKELVSVRENVDALLRERLPPEVVALLQDGLPTRLHASSVDSAFGETRPDRIFRYQRRDLPGGVVYCLLEHKSTRERDLGLQLLRYLTEAWGRAARERPDLPPPLIIPLVVYHGRSRWLTPRRYSDPLQIEEAVRRQILDFPIEVFDVAHVPESELSNNPWLAAGLLALKYGVRFPDEPPRKVVDRLFRLLAGAPTRLWRALTAYILDQFPVQPADVQKAMAALSEREREIVRTAWDEIVERGKKIGEKQGEARGRKVGEARGRKVGEARGRKIGEARGRKVGEARGRTSGFALALLTILKSRFGRVPAPIRKRIETARLPELKRWVARVEYVESYSELFEDA
jgi:hypothetical protein